MMWDLFGREKRDAIARNETRATMDALDKTVNGQEPVPDDPSIKVQVTVSCARCKTALISDPVKQGRMIDPTCKYAIQIYLDAPKGGK